MCHCGTRKDLYLDFLLKASKFQNNIFKSHLSPDTLSRSLTLCVCVCVGVTEECVSASRTTPCAKRQRTGGQTQTAGGKTTERTTGCWFESRSVYVKSINVALTHEQIGSRSACKLKPDLLFTSYASHSTASPPFSPSRVCSPLCLEKNLFSKKNLEAASHCKLIFIEIVLGGREMEMKEEFQRCN